MTEAFYKNLIKKEGITPPAMIMEALLKNFPGAINCEWFEHKSGIEAIFYIDTLEYIALFSPDGCLMEYKKFLPFEFLPEPMKDIVAKKGELMNAVMINLGNSLYYEIIYRDKNLDRFFLLLDETAGIKDEKKL